MRFIEVVSTQKIFDEVTGDEYNGLVDDGFLELINKIADENEFLKKRLVEKDELLSKTLRVQSNLEKKIRELEDGKV